MVFDSKYKYNILDIKNKYDSLESTLVSFLEFITSPFNGILFILRDIIYRKQFTARFNNGRFALLVGD